MNSRWMRSRWSLGAVALLAAIAGVVILGGFNTAMHMTNSLAFCTSCHAMRDNVFQEYKKTAHYTNRTGVRAICSDCHVPRDWSHMLMRKLNATKELYHWAIGSIDTREKFEAKRHELARHEWDRMRANGSRECRNCHSFEAMDFHKQNARSATAMQEAMKAGKTCIDCHKGIAHTMPDVTATHRAAFAALQAEAAKLIPAVGLTVYTIGPVPFQIDGTSEGGGGGELAPATAVTVRNAGAGRIELDLVGWQREGSLELLYQQQGVRILAATLSEAAAARLEPLQTTTDDDTGLQWTKMQLRITAATGRFADTLDPLLSVAARMHDDNCSLCHTLKLPRGVKADDWIGHLNTMKRYTALTADEVALLRSYLQTKSREASKSP
jgi:trimethylamine-N-oxide reductase (cytochrome c), cytochrome c-type subunit TorC